MSDAISLEQSAATAHAGSYAYDPAFASAGKTPLAGMIVVSGRVRIDNLKENLNAKKVEQYYGTDASRFEGYSPVHHINRDSVATFVAWAEFENPLIDVYCAELAYRLAEAKRKSPPTMWLPGHNHSSAIAHLGRPARAGDRPLHRKSPVASGTWTRPPTPD